MSIRYVDLADYLAIAAEITELDTTTLISGCPKRDVALSGAAVAFRVVQAATRPRVLP